MSGPDNTIRLIVITTADDVDQEFNIHQPLQVVFNKALREVGGAPNRDQFVLEYGDNSLTDLTRKIEDLANEFGWVDGTVLELIPTPVVV